jgi:hypothetical protein
MAIHTDNQRYVGLFRKAAHTEWMRMICETLAIACLVAHGDIKATKSGKLTKTYQADYIINELEKLHPDFYPRPTKQTTKNGLIGWEDITDPYLTKAELVASYRHTGNFLHVGDLQEVLSGKQRTLDLNPAVAWANKLVTLLNHHNIHLADPPERRKHSPSAKPIVTRQIVAMMQGTNGQVSAHFFEALV